MDADGAPNMTNVFSRFRVIWADGKTTPIGLNQLREDDAAVLYTSVTGTSTRTDGRIGRDPWNRRPTVRGSR
jgi:hypothetical protein